MRAVLPAAALALSLVAPAHAAPNAGTVVCTLTYTTTVGPGQGHGSCTAYGSFSGVGSLAFSTSNGCPLSTAAGTGQFFSPLTSVAVTFSFAWTRVGPTGVVTTSNGMTGGGKIVFSSPCPANGETAVFSAGGA